MTKKDKLKAFREAIRRAKETLAYYEKKSLEELEEMDTSELTCIGCDFNWLPNSGYDYDQDQQKEAVEWLCECADKRKARQEHFYKVSFKAVGLVFRVCQRGKKNEPKIIEEITAKYPQVAGLDYAVETIRKADF